MTWRPVESPPPHRLIPRQTPPATPDAGVRACAVPGRFHTVAILAAGLLAGSLLIAQSAAADPILIARATVNGEIVYGPKGIQGGRRGAAGAKGIAIAVARVYTPEPDKQDYRVSGEPGGDAGNKKATKGQAEALDDIVARAEGVYATGRPGDGKRGSAADVREAQSEFGHLISVVEEGFADDPDFPTVAKAKDKPLVANTDDLQHDNPVERADADLRQTLVPLNAAPAAPLKYHSQEKLIAEARTAKGPDAKALALGLNFDPLVMEWDDTATLRVDLSELWLEASTEGLGSSAITLFQSRGSFINGTTDLDADPRSAAPLFELSMFAFSFDGGSVEFDLVLNTFGNEVSDSLANVGLPAVQSALLQQWSAAGPRVGFGSGYFFDVVVPGDPDHSLLFLNDAGLAGAQVVPEPSTTAILLLGCCATAIARRRPRRYLRSTATRNTR